MELQNLDFWIKSDATAEQQERYEAVLILFSNYLFQNSFGEWCGKETALTKTTWGRTNYFYIKASKQQEIRTALDRFINNFRVMRCTKVTFGEPFKDDEKLIKQLKKCKQFSWVYFRIDDRK